MRPSALAVFGLMLACTGVARGEGAITLESLLHEMVDRSMHLHANWRQQWPIATKGGAGTMDWNYIEIQGQGVYVGDTLAL